MLSVLLGQVRARLTTRLFRDLGFMDVRGLVGSVRLGLQKHGLELAGLSEDHAA